MSSVSKVWLRRIGPEATATLERSFRLSRWGGAGGLVMMVAFWFFTALKSDLGMGLTFIGMLVWMPLFFVRAIYLQIQARKQAGEHLQLAPGEWKWLSVRSYDKFDSWVSQHVKAPGPFDPSS